MSAAAPAWSSPLLRHAVPALVLAAAVLLGRSTVVEGGTFALVWPAAAVGSAWVVVDRARGARGVTALVGVTLITGVLNALTGAPPALAAVMAVANGLQSLVTALLLDALPLPRGASRRRLRTPADLRVLVLAALLGAATGAAVSAVGVAALGTGDPLAILGAWTLRSGSATLVLGAAALRLADPARWPWRGLPRRTFVMRSAEVAAVAGAVGAAYAVVFGYPQELPLPFLLVPFSIWVALRLDTTAVALHGVAVGVVVVVTTLAGHGPFVVVDPDLQPVLAQAFVTVVSVVALPLALARDERTALISELSEAQATASEQALLLRTVFEASTEALSVHAADGTRVLRNAAATRLLADLPADDLPLGRALGGETVEGVDVVVDAPDAPGRVLDVSARRVPGAGGPWEGAVVLAARDVTDERRASARVAAARDLYSGILDAATEQAIIRCDPDGTITVFSTGAQRMTGWGAEEVAGLPLTILHDPAELSAVAAARGLSPTDVLLHDARSGYPVTLRWTWLRADASRLHAMVTVSPLVDAAGRCTGVIALATDVTEQVVVEQRLAGSESRFRRAFDTAPVAMAIVGLGGPQGSAVLQVNATMGELTGLAAEELLARDLPSLLHPDDRPAFLAALGPLVDGGLDEVRVEQRFLHADGSVRRGLVHATLFTPDGAVGDGVGGGQAGAAERHLLCLVEDVTARREAEEELVRLALHDPLTGLPNRALLRERLGDALREAEHEGVPGSGVGVLFCDLDGFKAVNDAAGHAAGDDVLRAVAERFWRLLRPVDTLARLGGDEFAVVLPGLPSPDELAAVADALLAAVAEPVVLPAGAFRIGVSIGTAWVGAEERHRDGLEDRLEDGLEDRLEDRLDALVDAADAAMYEAKRAGKNRVRRYRPAPSSVA